MQGGSAMTGVEHVILVVNRNASAARNLKDLIEFMDTPPVVVAAPEDWQERLGRQRPDALFIGPDMSDREVGKLLSAIGDLDPNIPIVMMNADAAA